jgi:hypothetical protein
MSRRTVVQKTVEYICQQVGQLKIVENLPEANIRPDQLINRATDVLSASLNYLAVYIRREPGLFGVLGIFHHSVRSN